MNKVTLFTLFVLATSMVLDCDAMLRLDAAGQRYHRLQNKIAADRQKYSAIPREHYFTQKLDHFNHQDTRTWQQRYFVNDSFWNPALGGPVFLQIGGEGAISPGYVLTMEMVVYAQAHGALVLALEHRFYGKSQPLPDLSTSNLQYLSSQQALADVAYFISNVRSSIKGAENSQFVTFGCSYPGNLAAWFRLKYPFQTTGSVASSAPVQATLDFYEYLDVVDESLSTLMGVQCDNRIQQATDQIQSMLNSTTGRQQLQTMFSTCTPLDNDLDIATFMSDLMGNWMGTVQYNDEGGNPIDINYLCGIMENDTMSALDAYIEVSNLFLQNQKASCLDISYSAMIEELQNVNSSKHGVGIRQWTYQTCFEFGYFQTTDSEGQPFGDLVPLEYWLKMCNDTFDPNGTMGGINVAAHVNETNILYGGNKPHGATNILFVNGSIDPWHSLGVTTDINESTTAILIQGTAHCANTNPATPNDPPGLAMAQSQINKQISIWLMEGNQ